MADDLEFPWVKYFDERFNMFCGYLRTMEQVEKLIESYEIYTTTKYVKTRRTPLLGKEITPENSKKFGIMFPGGKRDLMVQLPFDGVPFIVVGRMERACHQGKRYRKRLKSTPHDTHNYAKIKGRAGSKKMDCTATIFIREIIRFPEFQIEKSNRRLKQMAGAQVRAVLQGELQSVMDRRIYIQLPALDSHSEFHAVGKEARTHVCVDRRILDRIHTEVQNGVIQTTEMERIIEEFVRSDLQPDPAAIQTRRFSPLRSDIRCHIYNALMHIRRDNLPSSSGEYVIPLGTRPQTSSLSLHDSLFMDEDLATDQIVIGMEAGEEEEEEEEEEEIHVQDYSPDAPESVHNWPLLQKHPVSLI